jgi:hypothetical protein
VNKNTVIVIGVVLLLGIVGFALLSTRSAQPVSNQPGQAAESTETSGSPTSLKDLLAKGVAQTCTFSNDASSGTVAISGGKVRGDFDATVEGNVVKSHMIVDGNTSYIWMDGQATGFKATFDAEAAKDSSTTTPKTAQGSIDANESLNYNCKPGIINASAFDLPKDVSFTEFSIPTIAPSAKDSGTGSTSDQCAVCNSLSGDSKTQCLKALNCE